MSNKTGEQKRLGAPKSERLKARLKRLDQQIAQPTQRERNQEKKVENLRYLLGRTADTALIYGELDLARLEPLVEKHLQKTRDRDSIRQFFSSRVQPASPLLPRPLSPLESALLGIRAHHPSYSSDERRRIYRRHYLWGLIAEAEGWNEA